MFINTISNSKYNTFKQCKLKYKYKYINRLQEDEGGNTDPLHFGSYIHKILEEGVNATTFGELDLLAEEHLPNYKFGPQYNGKTEICIKNFLKFNASLKETVAAELPYEIEIKDNIKLNGIIDRVVKGEDGGYLVIDYKTSKREKTQVELYQDPQLQGYCFAVHELYKVPISNIVVAHYYPVTGNLVTCTYGATQINNYLRNIINEVWRIRKMKSSNFCASENEFCNWCSYKSLCPLFSDTMTLTQRIEERKTRKKFKKA